jgi:hypothetical protein
MARSKVRGAGATAWSVVDGKLYLNYDRNVQASWVKDIPGYIRKADANWPKALAR